ncbi:MAG: sugar phosphate isomerase/epimerase [Planctomycetaceae bacterium]|nr:sugar phosphate isomerase/epimerase [Planctomycetaceae bacterium]
MLPRLALATQSLKLPLRSALKAARLLQVQGVRIDARLELKPRELSQTARRELSHLIKEFNLQLTSLSFAVRRSLYDQDDLDARVAATRDAMELASKLAVSHLCMKIGKVPDDPNSPEYQQLHETVSDLARYGNHIGVILSIIPMGESPENLKEFLDSIRTGPVAIDFDPAIMTLNGINPVQALRFLHQYIEQFTARDAVRDFTGGGQEVPVGRGEIIWDETLATLEEISYKGWLTVQRNLCEHPKEEIAQSLTYLKNVAGELGWG